MSSLLSAELAATCNALGYFNPKTNNYYADSNTLETVKDLIRYLRRDDESHDIRRHLGETQVLQTDLLPLLKSYWQETDLFDVLLRLLVNLTSPALMLWHEELPTEKSSRNHYLQIEDHLQKYKQAFADEAVWAVLSTRISKILETDFSERGEENSLIIERILILIRNVLYVPANPDAEKRPDNDASVHDQVLWALHRSGMIDIILFIASSTTEQAYYMHALEILSFMLREQSASELAHAALQRSQTEKMRDQAELLAIRHRETNQKQQKIKMYNGARHSRFGGTFVVKSMKSISDNELIYHKPLNRLEALNFDADKKKPKTPKNRLPVQSTTSERRSAFSIRLVLKEFCIEFLNGAYNTLMYHVKDNLVRAKAQAHDESYYLWALRFFMEFNRCYKFEVKLVSETMSIHSFHFVQQQMEKYFDMLSVDKKKINLWARRMHLALLAYRELLLTINAMDKSPDGSVRDSAKVIKSNIFYVVEYRELIITLLVTFDELKLSGLYLNDLIETQHIFIRMFQSYCEKYGDVVVQKKAKAKKKRKKASAASVVAAVPEMNLETMWDEAAPQLSAVLEGASHIPTDVVPFDAASEVPIDEQKVEAMKNIQRNLRDNEFENALGLLRAAREVWPENDSFGNSAMAPEEELFALRDIFFADFGENTQPRNNLPPQQEEASEEDEEENEEELEGWTDISETNFKFSDFTNRLAHPKVVRACGLALRNFEHNSVQTNHCIVKLLHRIAWDSKMYPMIFQTSIFRTFQKIYASKSMPQYKELVKFAAYIMRQFFKLVETNPKVFLEALFWKSSRDAFDIEHGYGSYQTKSVATSKAWTEIQEDELRRLFMEHQEKQITEDVVDWIVNNLIDNTRSRAVVIKKLKEMCLLTEYKRPRKSGISGKIPRQWGEDEEAQLRELYEQFKDAMDPLGCIMDRLDVPRPRNRIVEKLLVMGLIQDKKEVRKKRAKKSQGPGAQGGSGTSKNRRMQGPLSKTRLVNLLKKFTGMTEALEWLRDNFSDVIEDLEEDPDTDNEIGVPLIAILDAAVSALENKNFQNLLRAFGIQEPGEDQGIYWRIPSNLTKTALQEYCRLITNHLENLPPEAAESIENNNTTDSDDEDVPTRARQITKDTSKKLPKARNNTRKQIQTRVPKTTLLNLLKNVAGMTDALKWLRDSFSDIIEDLEENPDDNTEEGVPLVAILDAAVSAMENENFKRLIRGFGVKEPADEQEMYWRIPSNLTVATLQEYCELLTNVLENKPSEVNELIENNVNNTNTADSDDEAVFTRVRQIVNDSNNALKEHLSSRGINSGSESDSDVNSQMSDVATNVNTSRKKTRITVLSSDDENDDVPKKTNSEIVGNFSESHKRAVILDDEENSVSSPESLLRTNRNKSIDSKTVGNIIKRKRRIVVLDSDDENQEQTVEDSEQLIENGSETLAEVTQSKNKHRILDSDSDGDSSEKENIDTAADNNKRQRNLSDSEGQAPKPKRSRVLVSDEED